jgi:hypothetical protein
MRVVSLEFSSDGKTYKIKFTHTCTDGHVWTFTLPGAIWYVVSLEPLTIMPTITCGRCQLRGWYRKGSWQDAPTLDAGRTDDDASRIANT